MHINVFKCDGCGDAAKAGDVGLWLRLFKAEVTPADQPLVTLRMPLDLCASCKVAFAEFLESRKKAA